MKRVLSPRPDMQPALVQPPVGAPPIAPTISPAIPVGSPAAAGGNGVSRSTDAARAAEPLPPIECEEYFRAGVTLVEFELKDPEGPLYNVAWQPPDNGAVDLDKLKHGILAHIPGAKWKDFYTGRGRGGLANMKEAANLHCAINRGREGLIVRFSSPDIPNGAVACWYDNPPEKQFLAALDAASVQLSEQHRALIERVQRGDQRDAAIFGVPLRIRFGESSSGSLIVESLLAEGGGA
jgi:hypothetical protein